MLNYLWGGMILIGIVTVLVRMIIADASIVNVVMTDLFASASLAVEVCIGLAGMMCLWLGIAKIMDKSGLTQILAKWLTPLFQVIMPEIPKGHPAMSSITLNLAANMLGLDNAATPLGIRAMRDLETLNPQKGVATNAEIMFLVLNTSAVTIVPISIILYRTKFGAVNPTDVFLPLLLATSCSTIAGFLAVAFMQRLNLLKLPLLLAFALLVAVICSIAVWSYCAASALVQQATIASNVLILLLIGGVIAFAMIKKLKVFDDFILGAKEGFTVCVEIMPYLVGMLFAIAVFKASGVLTFLLNGIQYIVDLCNLDHRFVDALPVSFMHPLSGSGARAMMLEVFNSAGVDSFVGHLAAIMQGSTETTFYVLAVYFGAVGITKVRHAVGCGLVADFTAMIAAIFMAYLFFGELV